MVSKRKHRPMFMVDIAVPRDIEPAAGELDDVYLYTVDDLQDVIEENIRNRREAAKQAEEIIDTQVGHFMDWMNSLNAVNTIVAIREKAAHLKQESLDSALRRLHAGDDPETVLHELARNLTNKLIHDPSARLSKAEDERREALLTAAQELFSLSPGALPPEDDDNPEVD